MKDDLINSKTLKKKYTGIEIFKEFENAFKEMTRCYSTVTIVISYTRDFRDSKKKKPKGFRYGEREGQATDHPLLVNLPEYVAWRCLRSTIDKCVVHLIHEPHVMMRNAPYSLQQQQQKWEISLRAVTVTVKGFVGYGAAKEIISRIRAGFFNPNTSLKIPAFV
ncbi:hypothetical protein TNCV_2590021 [Trichonephila clavipes]|nr:hypothetical protein TNCV_2590021 [Trichonephila clavipes]